MLFELQEENLYLSIKENYGFHEEQNTNFSDEKYLINHEIIKDFLTNMHKYKIDVTDSVKYITKTEKLKRIALTILPLYLDRKDSLVSGFLQIEILAPLDVETNELSIAYSFGPFVSFVYKNLYPLDEKVFKMEVLLSIATKCQISIALIEFYTCDFMDSQRVFQEYVDKLNLK